MCGYSILHSQQCFKGKIALVKNARFHILICYNYSFWKLNWVLNPNFQRYLVSTRSKLAQSWAHCKVSVQRVGALGGHFAILCRELDYSEVFFFFIINFQKEKAHTFALLILLIVKSLQIDLHSTNLLLWRPICRNKRAITPNSYNS